MDVDCDKPESTMTILNEVDVIIDHLTRNESIVFKNQQRGEADLTPKEKSDIALNLYEKSKLNFLLKFGNYMETEHLKHFKKISDDSSFCESVEIGIVLKDIMRDVSTKKHNVGIKNRRYEALKRMVEEDTYFSEVEMMKRNPLLYEQLVGQYLSEEEKKERDSFNNMVLNRDNQMSFVKILMEGIERDNAEIYKKRQEEREDDQMEEEDSSSEEEDGGNKMAIPKPSTSRWGEFEEFETKRLKHKKRTIKNITSEERRLLKEEFVTTMYENFLEGKDEDFDYSSLDKDTSYDNINEMEHDALDEYFDGEDANCDISQNNADMSSEDELDIYMNALNQHPAVCQLATDVARL